MELSVREFIKLGVDEPWRLDPDHPDYDPVWADGWIGLATQADTNPLLLFEPHSDQQREFIEARTAQVAAFAGNRFGKTTSLVACCLREVLDAEDLPPHLRPSKRYAAPTQGWVLCPTEDKIFDTFKPAFERWTPPGAFKGGNWGKAFNGARMELTFKNESTIAFKTYKQDPSTLGSASLHFVGYDEPPPKTHRSECKMRLVDKKGFEMFAMTPIRANTSWIRRDLWRKREAPNLTVVKASIHDNPFLDAEAIEEALGVHSELERKAREYGDFMDLGGMIFPDFDRCVAEKSFPLDFIRGLDIVVGIDPGIRNAGFAWVGFDKDLVAYVFNEGMLQDTEAHGYAAFIKSENKRLGLRNVSYVCDPAARSRGQVNAETVMQALAKHDIHANAGQNSHEAGFDQMRTRMRLKRFRVDPACFGIRDEADDYAAKEVGDDEDNSHMDPVSNRFHRLDALRYAVMERFWDPVMEEQAPLRTLGFDPSHALPAEYLKGPQEAAHPMGSMF